MRIELDILKGIGVPVFAVSVVGPPRIVAWNVGMATVTGVPMQRALGRSPEAVLGPGGALLQTNDQVEDLHIDGLGAVQISRQGELLVGTFTDHERDAFIGLAAQDLRGPLRTIHQLADAAARDGFAAQAALSRIKRIARQGMSMTGEVLSCAEAGGVAVSRFRKQSVPPLCHALVDALNAANHDNLTVMPATVIAEKPVLQAALRRIFEHVLRWRTTEGHRIFVDARSVPTGFCIGVAYDGIPLRDHARRLLEGGRFRGDEGYGLLGLRRLVRSRGGTIAIVDDPGVDHVRVDLTLPGCLLDADRTAARRKTGA